jgi:hypothetical protein
MRGLDDLDAAFLTLVVKNHVLYYLKGAELALYELSNDFDRAAFQRFARECGHETLKRASDYKNSKHNNVVKDFRGLLCMIMDDLGIRNYDKRDAVIENLTGKSRMDILEEERQHRISQGDHWLKKEGE